MRSVVDIATCSPATRSPRAQRQQLEDWMRANETSSMRAGLPQGWATADKTGSGDYGSTNDVGISYGPRVSVWCLR
jgi:beta-lactamase class A